jgi:hypothetical protein
MQPAGRTPQRAPEPDAFSADRPNAVADESHLAGWIDEISRDFGAAAADLGLIERRIRITGAPVRIRGAGNAMLEQLGPAFDHLADGSGDVPELTISTWDSASAGVAAPPLPETDPEAPRGAVFYSTDGRRQVAYQPGLSLLSAYDADARAAWFWCRNAADLPFWEPAAPFRQILHWWLADRGLMLLHGGSVGRPSGGVLFVGRGGSGKSTCALSSLRSDLLYAGDDYVAVAPDPEPYVYSLYCSGKLQPGHAKLLSHLPPPSFDGDGTPEEKAVFYVGDRFPERMAHGFPLKAVVVPRIRGSEPRLYPVSAPEAVRALAPSTLLQLHPARPEALTSMTRLLGRIPAYGFDLSGSIDSIPVQVDELLQRLEQ